MPHTNRAELTRLFAKFCHLWTKGLHANVQMKTTGRRRVVAQFEFQLEKPNEIFPTGPAGFRQGQPQGEPRRHPRHQPGSSHAPGHPGATGGRRSRPRRRGPKAIERSKMRAAAHQASLAAARCAATATVLPTPPPTGPGTTNQGRYEADQLPVEFFSAGWPGWQHGQKGLPHNPK